MANTQIKMKMKNYSINRASKVKKKNIINFQRNLKETEKDETFGNSAHSYDERHKTMRIFSDIHHIVTNKGKMREETIPYEFFFKGKVQGKTERKSIE